jgi:hypothetical protein
MFARKYFSVACLFALASAACAAESNTEAADDDLTGAAEQLVGAYKGENNPFTGLVLTGEKVGQQAKFFADVDTGIRCFRAPCPSSARIEGTWSAGSKTITLRAEIPAAGNFGLAERLIGKYDYRVQGQTLSLSKDGSTYSLSKEHSYCAAPADCDRQGIITPACVGSFTCSEVSTCSWRCGAPPPLDRCRGKDEEQCRASSGCRVELGPSHCSEDGLICTKDIVFKGCVEKQADACAGLDLAACEANAACAPQFGSSCPLCRDWQYKGCNAK